MTNVKSRGINDLDNILSKYKASYTDAGSYAANSSYTSSMSKGITRSASLSNTSKAAAADLGAVGGVFFNDVQDRMVSNFVDDGSSSIGQPNVVVASSINAVAPEEEEEDSIGNSKEPPKSYSGKSKSKSKRW